MAEAVREIMPPVRAHLPFPCPDLRLGEAKGSADGLLAQHRPGLARAMESAQEEDQQPAFKGIPGFPKQREGPAQIHLIAVLAGRGDLNRGGRLADHEPGAEPEGQDESARAPRQVRQDLQGGGEEQEDHAQLIQALEPAESAEDSRVWLGPRMGYEPERAHSVHERQEEQALTPGGEGASATGLQQHPEPEFPDEEAQPI